MNTPKPLVRIVDHQTGSKVFCKESTDANGEDTKKVKRIVSADPKEYGQGEVREAYEVRDNWKGVARGKEDTDLYKAHPREDLDDEGAEVDKDEALMCAV